MNAGRTVKPRTGSGDDAADQRAEAERRGLEELRARVADDLALAGSGIRPALAESGGAARARGLLGALGCPLVTSRIQRKPKSAASTAPTATTIQADDQADEDAGDADGESDRPDGRRGLVRGAVTALRIHVSARIQSITRCRRQRRSNCRNERGRAVDRSTSSVASPIPYSAQRRSTSERPRRSSRSPRATRACPRPGPCASRRSRSCRRRTGASERGRGGRAGPR